MNKKSFSFVLLITILLFNLIVPLQALTQPSINETPVTGPPYTNFSVSNSNIIIFGFEHDQGLGSSSIPITVPASGATYTFEKDGLSCAIADPDNCSGSDVSVPTGFSGTIQVINIGTGTSISEFKVKIESDHGNWQVNPTTDAPIQYIRAIPNIIIDYPEWVSSGQTGVVLDASLSEPIYVPSTLSPSPSVTSVNWAQTSGPVVTLTTSGPINEIAQFDAPTITTDTDLVFQATITDDESLTASKMITVTVRPPEKPVDCVLLLDTSGSMGWHRTGSANDLAGGCCSRLASAKVAARYFVNRLGTFASNSRIGVAIFPGEPAPSTVLAKQWTPATGLATSIDFLNIENDIGEESITCGDCSTIPSPASAGTPIGIPVNWNGTPTRDGLDVARSMLTTASITGEKSRIIVLLSNGAWNVGLDPADPTYLAGFVTDDIHIYTVGIGAGTDNVNHTSLQDISINTGVGTAGNPIGFAAFNVGDPLTEPNLIPFFEKIMADMVSVDFITDPHGTIKQGETKIHTVPITSHDSLVSITVSWESSQTDLLDFHVLDPNGQSFYPQISGNGYKNITLDEYSLEDPYSSGEWNLVITYPDYIGAAMSQAEEISYNYSVITQSTLNMKVIVDKEKYFTGDTMYIEARVEEDNTRLKGITIEAKVSHPSKGIGNWHFENRVSKDQLQEVPDEISNEPLSLLDKKNYVLLQQLNTKLPQIITEPTITFNDNGIDGDEESNDGIYACRFTGFTVPGIYKFYIIASGTAKTGEEFQRERQFQKYVDMIPDVSKTKIEGSIEERNRDGSGIISIKITPRDQFGNLFGPGRDPLISMMSAEGEPIGDVEDLLSGEYQQQVKLDNISENPKISISIIGLNLYNDLFSKLIEIPRPEYDLPPLDTILNYYYRYPVYYYPNAISSYLYGYAPSVPVRSFVVPSTYDQTWFSGYSFVTYPYQPPFPQANIPWSIIPYGRFNYQQFRFYQPNFFINSQFNYPQNYYLNSWLGINRQ